MSRILILDTSVIVDDLRSGRHQQRMANLSGLVRSSSVVLAELWRGARKKADRDFLEALELNQPILVPTQKNWLDSGQLLAKIGLKKGFGPEKLRDLHFDVLIALTARNHGATVITTNRADFELIRSYRAFDLEVW